LAAASALLFFAAAPVAAAGLAAAELFGLNMSPSENLGDGDADGLGVVPASDFLRPRLAFGEVAGDSAGDAAVSAGDAAV
jgi:hypothetical protein